LFAATTGTAAACSDAGGGPNGTAGASGSAGAAAPVAGLTGGGGSNASGSGGAPVTTTGGAGSSGAPAPIAGSGGTAGTDMPSGGRSGSAGISGTGGASPMLDAGPVPTEADPSAGCNSSAGRPAGGVVTVAQTYYLTFPDGYDGSEPFPVLVGFHGCGGVNRGTNLDDTEWIRLTDGRAFETEYVRAVPLSADSGGCWNYNTDIVRVKQMYDDLLANHCVDKRRVFATGHSSGAQFIVQILTANHTADAQHLSFKAVAPVAASDYGAITGPIPVMYIQGMMDAERGNGDGHETVERFRAANGCGSSSMPYSEVDGCQSGATSVDPGCVIYDDCDAPTVWCSHNDPAYSGTMHGVPCFAMTAMHDFFESLM
jgi:poly(3-hydroxybutyrate) depolymerase